MDGRERLKEFQRKLGLEDIKSSHDFSIATDAGGGLCRDDGLDMLLANIDSKDGGSKPKRRVRRKSPGPAAAESKSPSPDRTPEKASSGAGARSRSKALRLPNDWKTCVFSWGLGLSGQLGLAHSRESESRAIVDAIWKPKLVPKRSVDQSDLNVGVLAGRNMSFCAAASGRVYAWGTGHFGTGRSLGEDGSETIFTPTCLPGLRAIRYLACGANHCAAVDSGGRLFTWGNGESGKLGHGAEADQSRPRLVAKAEEIGRCVGVACGQRHTVVILSENKPVDRSCLESAEGLSMNSTYAPPRGHVQDVAAADAKDEVEEKQEDLGRAEGGALYAFGSNRAGQLGQGHFRDEHTPKRVRGHLESFQVVAVACGMHHTVCLAHADRTLPGGHFKADVNMVFTFGWSEHGRLGIETKEDSVPDPRRVILAERFDDGRNAASGGDEMGERVDGQKHNQADALASVHAYLYGDDADDVARDDDLASLLREAAANIAAVEEEANGVGVNTDNDESEPVEIAAGEQFTLTRTADGRVWAWGCNEFGQCGTGAQSDGINLPHVVQLNYSKGVRARRIAAGLRHAAALTTDGNAYAWGFGEEGQLGIGVEANRFRPTKIPLPKKITESEQPVRAIDVALGAAHSLLVVSRGDTKAAVTKARALHWGEEAPPLPPSPDVVSGPAEAKQRIKKLGIAQRKRQAKKKAELAAAKAEAKTRPPHVKRKKTRAAGGALAAVRSRSMEEDKPETEKEDAAKPEPEPEPAPQKEDGYTGSTVFLTTHTSRDDVLALYGQDDEDVYPDPTRTTEADFADVATLTTEADVAVNVDEEGMVERWNARLEAAKEKEDQRERERRSRRKSVTELRTDVQELPVEAKAEEHLAATLPLSLPMPEPVLAAAASAASHDPAEANDPREDVAAAASKPEQEQSDIFYGNKATPDPSRMSVAHSAYQARKRASAKAKKKEAEAKRGKTLRKVRATGKERRIKKRVAP
uniref:Uncharacterized protein n=1 Tax=Phaeomonas parva TaxID=124430 RepID=A0A7S1U7V0_9STRA|mmetsp:Transcript_35466/g.111614  ORF Transcript_35466/g.111614 Transcript_35466/m.111614 type:complete len:980 (+) Transcript_35466:222-3161(+)